MAVRLIDRGEVMCIGNIPSGATHYKMGVDGITFIMCLGNEEPCVFLRGCWVTAPVYVKRGDLRPMSEWGKK